MLCEPALPKALESVINERLWPIKTKARNEMATLEVAAKCQAAEEWGINASAHSTTYGDWLWRQGLVAHYV